jgi:hypothetical protein
MAADARQSNDFMELLESCLEVFFGEATNTQARIYAQLEGLPPGNWSMTGTMSGPTSRYAQTLPSTYRFMPVSGGRISLAEALVLDPCFWTPATPNLYTVQIQLRDAGEVVAQTERAFGIRPLGAAGRSLRLEGKRWVLRAVDARCVPPTEMSDWRDASAAMLVASPNDGLCKEAGRIGLLFTAELPESTSASAELRRLARWPAVGVAILSSTAPLDDGLRKIARNMLLVQRLRNNEETVAAWVSAVLVSADQLDLLVKIASLNKPVLVERAVPPQASVADARGLCDLLQRDTAGLGDFAGYVIGAR